MTEKVLLFHPILKTKIVDSKMVERLLSSGTWFKTKKEAQRAMEIYESEIEKDKEKQYGKKKSNIAKQRDGKSESGKSSEIRL